jgi:curved DNA-binding protein CbpA
VPPRIVPDDDLYARLELTPDASPEAIELAWRALLKRHHPDIAGDDRAVLELAKRINIAHDWLSDRDLRTQYDRERLEPAGGGVRGGSWSPRGGTSVRRSRPRPRPRQTDLHRGDLAHRLAWFLDRVTRLTPDELDRMEAAEPPPIAFHATIRRFVPPEAGEAYAAVETALAARVAPDRWATPPIRDALLGVAAELAFGASLDELLGEPFRSRTRERLLRAWEASVGQPRHGPHGADVRALLDRIATLTPDEVHRFVRASAGIPGGARPWPVALDPEDDEALRISATLAARDAAGCLPADGLTPAAAARAHRLLGRLGHVVSLRHAFPAREYEALLAPWHAAVGAAPASRAAPRVRRAPRAPGAGPGETR